jgi:hypothetical protein
MDSILAISATPGPGTPPAPPPPAALATPGMQLPEGEPADPATMAAVTATIREFVACDNAGDPRRQFAFYTDNVLREFETQAPLSPAERAARFGGRRCRGRRRPTARSAWRRC